MRPARPLTCHGLLPIGERSVRLQNGFLYCRLRLQEALEDLIGLKNQEGTKNSDFHWEESCYKNNYVHVIIRSCFKLYRGFAHSVQAP